MAPDGEWITTVYGSGRGSNVINVYCQSVDESTHQ